MADAKTSLGGISWSLEKRTGCGLESGRFLHEGKAHFSVSMKKKDKREEIDTNNKEIEPLKE